MLLHCAYPRSGRYLVGFVSNEIVFQESAQWQICERKLVQRFGGFVAKYMGDGVLIYFGYPQAHEDDAERAVRAGLALVVAVSDLKTHAPLQTRVGIATRLVVVGDLVGSGASQEPTIAGETPNPTSARPACPSRASGWPSLTTLRGFPCCVRFPCVHAAATTPAQRLGVSVAQSPSRISLPRKGCRVGLRIVLFEACSAFTRVAACTLAPSPIRDTLSEGFSYFVTSIAAPVASGWSVRRVGFAPTGKRRLITAHTQSGPDASAWAVRRVA